LKDAAISMIEKEPQVGFAIWNNLYNHTRSWTNIMCLDMLVLGNVAFKRIIVGKEVDLPLYSTGTYNPIGFTHSFLL